MIKLGLLLFVSVASFSIAENRGVSHLGMCHKSYDCSGMKESFKGAPVIRTGWVDNTFNPDGCKCITVLQESEKPVIARVHITNGAGLRNGRLDKHEIFHGHTVKSAEKSILRGDLKILYRFDERSAVVREQLNSIPKLDRCFVSPVLEANFSRTARSKLLRRTRANFKKCRIVDNPLTGSFVRGHVAETHGLTDPPAGDYIADLDGVDLYETYESYISDLHEYAEMNLAWKYCNNLNVKGGTFKFPLKRKTTCSKSDVKQLNTFVIKGKGRR